jgi:hypothetical protein
MRETTAVRIRTLAAAAATLRCSETCIRPWRVVFANRVFLIRFVVYHRCCGERRYQLPNFIDRVVYADTGAGFRCGRYLAKRSPQSVACRVSRSRTAMEDSFVLTVTDFQNYAAACARLARATETEANKTALLMMAEKWTGLATQAERIRQLVKEADAVFGASDSQSDHPTERGSDS